MVVAGNVVVGDAAVRQNRADDEVVVIAIGRQLLAHDVVVKARTILDAENAADRAADSAERAANHRADRAGDVVALRRAFLRAAHGALRLRHHRQRQRGEQGRGYNKRSKIWLAWELHLVGVFQPRGLDNTKLRRGFVDT